MVHQLTSPASACCTCWACLRLLLPLLRLLLLLCATQQRCLLCICQGCFGPCSGSFAGVGCLLLALLLAGSCGSHVTSIETLLCSTGSTPDTTVSAATGVKHEMQPC